jgi:hypothetical protein
MAGNLMSTPTAFTSIAIGSGRSQGGSDYSGGSELLNFSTGTFATSAMTVAPYAVGSATFTIGKGMTTTDFVAVMPCSVNTAAFIYDAKVSSTGVLTLNGFNSFATAATQGAVVFRWVGLKVAP